MDERALSLRERVGRHERSECKPDRAQQVIESGRVRAGLDYVRLTCPHMAFGHPLPEGEGSLIEFIHTFTDRRYSSKTIKVLDKTQRIH